MVRNLIWYHLSIVYTSFAVDMRQMQPNGCIPFIFAVTEAKNLFKIYTIHFRPVVLSSKMIPPIN